MLCTILTQWFYDFICTFEMLNNVEISDILFLELSCFLGLYTTLDKMLIFGLCFVLLVTFIEEIVNRKLQFLCSANIVPEIYLLIFFSPYYMFCGKRDWQTCLALNLWGYSYLFIFVLTFISFLTTYATFFKCEDGMVIVNL